MAHLVENMAYVGAEPWHGLGNALPHNQSIEVWQRSAGMDWEVRETEVLYSVATEGLHLKPYKDGKVLYRSDTLAPLSVVGNRYQVVQPREVLEFYRDLVSAGGFELETAGVLKEGRKLWALAKTGQETILKGGDRVKAYLLLATSCDGTLATTAQFTSVRVVCNNTLQLAVGDRAGAALRSGRAPIERGQARQTRDCDAFSLKDGGRHANLVSMTRFFDDAVDKTARRGPLPPGHWLLQDAKARFSELVRRVRSEGPQHVTVHGRDEVVVIAAEEFHRLRGERTGQALIDAIQASPYRDLDIAPPRAPMPVRDVIL